MLNDKNNKDELFIDRYIHSKKFLFGVLSDLEILEFFPKEIDPVGLYLNKIMGFNCAIEAHLKRLEEKQYLWLYKSKNLSKLFGNRYIHKSKIAEIDSGHFNNLSHIYSEKIDILYVASIENYANALYIHATKNNKKNTVFFMPESSKKWSIYKKISKEFKVFFPSQIGISLDDYNMKKKFYQDYISTRLSKIDKKRYQYRNHSYFFMSKASIEVFFVYFVAQHITFVNTINSFFMKNLPRSLFISRDRRSTENSFVQVLSSLGVETNMIMHGVITSNYTESQLYTSHYQFVDKVHVWGEQQINAIEKKQKKLNERIPIINKDSIKFDSIIIQNKNVKKSDKKFLVVIGQKGNDNSLFKLSKKISNLVKNTKFQVVFRPHPDNSNRFRSSNFLFVDNGKNFISSSLSRAFLVITHSSTALLEGVSMGAGCILLDYKKFNQEFPSIYKEEFSINNCQCLITNNIDSTLSLIDECINNDSAFKKNLLCSKELYRWFVE
jgi:hypothetical protein